MLDSAIDKAEPIGNGMPMTFKDRAGQRNGPKARAMRKSINHCSAAAIA